jgi:predicted nucleic acid-binding protein
MNSILLDTSFCIRLLKKDDPLHINAVDYFEYFLSKKVELFLSAIVIAEYSVKDDINNLPLRSMKIIPFDFFDGKTAGEFHAILLNNKPLLSNIERLIIKDDCKLIAQIYNRKIEAYIMKDKKSFNQIIYPLLSAKDFSVETLDLAIPLKDYKNELF